jgi:hypothetical protein
MADQEIRELRDKILALLQVWIDIFNPDEDILHYETIEKWADNISSDINNKVFTTYQLGSRWTDRSELKVELRKGIYIRYKFVHNIDKPFSKEEKEAKVAKKVFKKERDKIFCKK